jgi:uncharacterized protein YndB with AHSA1/START domain
MSDILAMLNGTYREIDYRETPAGRVRSLLIRREYDAGIADVWEAITDPDRLRRWFLPVTGDLREGGTFQLKDNAGGEIRRCDPPGLLAVTWAYGDAPAADVELRLSESAGVTTLELHHAPVAETIDFGGRDIDPVLNDAETGIWGLGSGWELGFIGLASYLRGEFPADPEAAEMNPELIEAANRISAAWSDVVTASRT